MKPTRKFGLLFLGATAAAVISMTLPAGADSGVIQASGWLRDLAPATADPTDGAYAQVTSAAIDGHGSNVFLVVTGLDTDWVGTTLGAHVHSGSCVAGQPATAGPHYNTGGPADQDHEVWLDFRIRPGGLGFARASVPFVIPHGGAHAVVIHAMATQPGGGAGARWACLPVEF